MQNPEAEKHCKQAVDRAFSRDFAGALLLFNKALELDPDNAQYYSEKAITLLNLERYDETRPAVTGEGASSSSLIPGCHRQGV
jgi:Flp pilus assembly protein TadD